jgi:hypothetical protein
VLHFILELAPTSDPWLRPCPTTTYRLPATRASARVRLDSVPLAGILGS